MNLMTYGLTEQQIKEAKAYGLSDKEILEIIEINEYENSNTELDAIKLYY